MAERIIELGLQHQPDAARGEELLSLLDRILNLLPDAVMDNDGLRSSRFRKDIEQCREQLDNAYAIEPVARRLLDVCGIYFKHSKSYRQERENEYIELIDLLHEAITRLGGESTTFQAQILTSSDRFGKLVHLEDIREVRRQIAKEVQDLKRVVDEKQKRDEENFSKLTRRVDRLEAKLTRAKGEAATDSLTRLANRGAFDRTINRWVSDCTESGTTFALALADIDDFKKVNDTHGHPVGDRVLVCAAQFLADSTRPTDLVARYGGEEFAVLFAEAKLAQAEPRMDGVLKTIAAHRFDYKNGTQSDSVCFTLSCGITEFTPGDTVDLIIQRADEALYEAKRKGKNRVIVKKKSRLSAMFG